MDGLLIHLLSLVVAIVEGWRVRTPLFQPVVYAILANGHTQIVVLPLFFIEWRNCVRINDCIWNLDMEDPNSPVRVEAEKGGLNCLCILTPRRKNKPTAPLRCHSAARPPSTSTPGNDSASEMQAHGREAATPSTLRNRLAGRSCRCTPRRTLRSQRTPRAAALA